MSTEYRFNKRTGRLEGDTARPNQRPSRGRRIAATSVGLAWISVSAVIGTRVFWLLYADFGRFVSSTEPALIESSSTLGLSFGGPFSSEGLAVQLVVVGISVTTFASLSVATPIVLKWTCRRHVPYLIECSWTIVCAGLGVRAFLLLSQLQVEFLGWKLNTIEAFLLSLLTSLVVFYPSHVIIQGLRRE